MIDLRNKALPDTIIVDGRAFKLKTDYRVWLEFGEKIRDEHCKMADLLFVFEDDVPTCDFFNELMSFYVNPNVTPNDSCDDGNDTDLVDFILDGEYIYASFMKDYHIDLINTDLHWYKFKALFSGLSDDTRIKQIMSMRGYKKSDKKLEQQYEELKRVWQLPVRLTPSEQAILDEFNSL